MVVRGKRGCSLKLAFFLHILGFVVLVLGCLTPFWSSVQDKATGEVLSRQGLLVNYVSGSNWTFVDFNLLKEAGSEKPVLYHSLAITFGILAMFFEFFLLEALALALYNASCGKRYNPDWLMVFSLLAGLMAITSLVLFEQYTGRKFDDSTDVKLDFSRGAVVFFITASFLSAFVLVCDRKEGKK